MNKHMVEVLDITLTNGLFVMLDGVADGAQLFGPPQTEGHLRRLRAGTCDVLFMLLGLAHDADLDEDSQEKLHELVNQTLQYFSDALKSGIFEEPA